MVMVIDQMKIKRECIVCPTEITMRDKTGKRLVKSPEYNESAVKLSDGTRMTVGVCRQHKSLKDSDLEQVTKKMRQGWLEEVSLGIGNANWVENKGIKLVAVGVEK